MQHEAIIIIRVMGLVAILLICSIYLVVRRVPVGNTVVNIPMHPVVSSEDKGLVIPVHYTRAGVYVARLHVGPSRDPVECVLDTGSRHLSIRALDISTPGEVLNGPRTLYYGSQTDTVQWQSTLVNMCCRAGRPVPYTLKVAVAHARTCSTSRCFNVLGLSTGGSHTDDVIPVLEQLAGGSEDLSFCVALRDRTGGELRINRNCLENEGMHVFRLISGTNWYLTHLVGVFQEPPDGRPPIPLRGSWPDKIMIDTGSNMLGTSAARTRELHRVFAARGQGNLILRMLKYDYTTYDYVVPESVYRYDNGDLLVDPHEVRNDILVMGAMFLIGREIAVNSSRRCLGIR